MLIHAALVALSALSYVSAHGRVTSHEIRQAGTRMNETCGTNFVPTYLEKQRGVVGPLQWQLADPAYLGRYGLEDLTPKEGCNVWMCAGYQREERQHVYQWREGQQINMTVDITAAHAGAANVSVIYLTNNTILYTLKAWPSPTYGGEVGDALPLEQRNFTVTLPPGIGAACAKPDQCALQWYWGGLGNSDEIQYYENCIDFFVGDGNATSWGTTAATTASLTHVSLTTAPTSATPPATVSASSPPRFSTVIRPSATSSASAFRTAATATGVASAIASATASASPTEDCAGLLALLKSILGSLLGASAE